MSALAGRQTVRAFRAQLLSPPLFIGTAVRRRQHVAPASIGALVDEGLRATVPEYATQRRRLLGMRFHEVEGAVLDRAWSPRLIDRHAEEPRDAAHRAVEVALERVEVHEFHIRQ